MDKNEAQSVKKNLYALEISYVQSNLAKDVRRIGYASFLGLSAAAGSIICAMGYFSEVHQDHPIAAMVAALTSIYTARVSYGFFTEILPERVKEFRETKQRLTKLKNGLASLEERVEE